MKRMFVILVALMLTCTINSTAAAATPFTAPATFELAGSTIAFDVRVETARLGTINAALNPNPSAVTGQIDITTLDPGTGNFTGAFENIAATTNATTSLPGVNFPVIITINSNDVGGIFVWSRDRVVFHLNTLMATLQVGSQNHTFSLYGYSLPATYANGQLSIQGDIDQAVTYLGYQISVSVSLNLVGRLQPQTTGANRLWIALSTDHIEYVDGDTSKLYFSLGTSAAMDPVDIYLGLCAPDGACYWVPQFTRTLEAAVSAWEPTGEIYVPTTLLFDTPIPSARPPIGDLGSYQWVAGAATSGTMTLVSNVASAPFAVVATGGGNYEGNWNGEASIEGSNSECSGLADVQITITNNQIAGEANENKPVDADGYELTGSVMPDGSISGGVIWEEFGAGKVEVGFYEGTFSGSAFSGSWQDVYGCYGTFTMTKTP